MAATQQQTSTSSNGHSAAVTALGAEKQSTDALQAKSTHHAPRKRLFTKLQALVTSPKRADGLGAAIAGALKGRPRHDSNTNDEPETKYRERLASDASLNSGPHESRPNKQSPTSLSPSQASGLSATNEAASPSSLPTSHSSEGVYLTSSPVKRVDKLGLPGSTSVHTARSVKPVSDQEQRKPELPRIITEDVVAPGPQTLLRPHLKLRIVTWNMHDSLPTGDLTELLGAPSAACDTTSTAPLLEPYDPDHALQPLSSGLSADAPYHLVVVGGQEVPVGYGGWSGPNWTETIQRWLAGGSKPLQMGATPLTPKEKDVPQSIGSNRLSKEALPLASPNTAHKKLLESQESETLALPEEILDMGQNESSLSVAAHPEDRSGSLNKFLNPDTPRGQLSNTDVHNEQISPRTPFSSAMSRNNSSDTANTDASARTNVKSVASQDGHVTDAPEAPEATPVQDSQSPYILVTKERLMGIYCSLWVHRSAAHLVQGSSTGTVTAGLLAGKVGNKGAACISLKIVDTRLLFVCAHLAAHSEKSALRQANVKKIKEELVIDTFLEDKDKKDKPRLKRGLSFSRPVQDRDRSSKEVASSRGMLSETEPGPGMDITELFDYTFWFGDLNFRLDISRLHADFLIKEKKFDTALTFDQLLPILKDGNGCFRGFSEAPITFAPSYKYDVLKLKRSKTIQKQATSSAGLGLTIGERRGVGQFSAPTSASFNTSKTNLASDVLDEEDEADNHSFEDRATVASSRASMSSLYSGFERNFADQETLANTSYNHRSSNGFFGTSIPSTPTADKVIEKAKGIFHLMRARSPAPGTRRGSDQEAEGRESLSLDTKALPDFTSGDTFLSPTDAYQAAPFEQFSPSVGERHRSQTPTAESRLSSSTGRQTDNRSVSAESASVRPLGDANSQSAAASNLIRSVTPILSPRPRLRSMRSTNTVFSMSSVGLGKSLSSSNQEHLQQEASVQEATYDTSSKKRVQSWTDRILYKSNVEVPDDSQSREAVASSSSSRSRRPLDKNSRRVSQLLAPAAVPGRVSFQETGEQELGAQSTPTFQRSSVSATSLEESQQRLHGRLANLFRRRSSGGKSSHQVEELEETSERQEGEIPVSSTLESVNTGGIARSQSLHVPKTTEVIEEIASHGSSMRDSANVSQDPLIQSRRKPLRAYTSPMPNSSPDSYVRDQNRTVQPMEAVTFESGKSMPTSSSAVHASADMARHGSEPLTASRPGTAASQSRSASEELLKRVTSADVHVPKRSFPLLHPFSRGNDKQDHQGEPSSNRSSLGDAMDRSGRTGITLSHSKTAPSSDHTSPTDHRLSTGLRQWWHARLLPHLFSSHSASSNSEGETPSPASDADADEVDPNQSLPVILGPRRGEIQCIQYNSISDLYRMEACSDHRPVVAVFAIGV